MFKRPQMENRTIHVVFFSIVGYEKNYSSSLV